jgi:hypothetical protein
MSNTVFFSIAVVNDSVTWPLTVVSLLIRVMGVANNQLLVGINQFV